MARLRPRLPIFLLLLGLALIGSASFTVIDETGRAEESTGQSGEMRASTEIASGLQRVIFTAKKERVFVNLPEHLAAGETFSGTVFGEALGATDAERAAGNDELRKYVVEVAGQKIPATGGSFKLSISTADIKDGGEVVLRDQKGKVISRARLKILAQTVTRGREFRLPTVQLGEMIQVDCPCDGNLADTDYLKVGGERVLPIAESSNARWAFNTNTVKGPTEIEMSEGGQVVRGKINILGLKLTADKTGLLKGESTKLTVEVSGLEGLKEPVPLRLENKTTDVLTMEPSNIQELTIKPGDVRLGGKYTTQRMLTGIRVGNFMIEGTVVRRDEPVSVADRERDASAVSLPNLTNLQSNQEAAKIRDALIQKIQNLTLPPPPQPEITSVSPAIGALVKESPRISWKAVGVPGEMQGVFYSLRIVEVMPEQSLQDALLKNRPVLERNNLTDTAYQVPSDGGLTRGNIYAFRVAAYGPGGKELGRSSNSFFGIGSWPSWTFCWLFSAGPVDYCIGQSSGVTVAYSFMTTSGAFSWTLTPQNLADPTVTGTSPVITIPANQLPTTPIGPHIYTLVATKGSCSRTLTITINAYPGAVGGAATVAPAQICDGQTAVLDVQGETGNVGQWEYSDDNITWYSATSAFFIAGAPANTNQMSPALASCTAPPWYTDRRFRAVVSASNDPSAPACSTTYSTPTTLRIYCKPVAGSVTASTTRFCKYSPPPFITLTMSGTVIGDFDWYKNGVLIPGSHNHTTFAVPPPASTTTYNTVVTTNGSCPPVTSNSVTVIVDDQPFCPSVGSALSVNPNLPVCPGDAATLTCNCTGIVTWQQSLTGPGGPWTTISVGNSVQNTTDLFATTWWQAIISGPPGSLCPQLTTNTVVINVKPPPPAPIVATPAPVCFGGPATLSSNLGPLPSGWGYTWYHDDLPITTCNNLATCTFAPAEPGNYWVEVFNGCETVQSNFVTIPIDLITINLNAPCCSVHVPLTLSASANSSLSGAINPALYTWYQGTTQIGTGPSITVNPTSTTTYCVKVSSPTVGGCSSTACATVTVCP